MAERGISYRFGPKHAIVGAVVALAAVFSSVDGVAQDLDISGATWLTEWPHTRPGPTPGEAAPPLDPRRYRLLPFIDSLSVRYRFNTDPDSPEFLSTHFAIDWVPGNGGILRGRPVGPERMPPGVVVESLDLEIPVLIGDRHVADLYLPLDSIALGPAPSMTFVDVAGVSWDAVFVDTDRDEARAILHSDFRFATPRIVRAVFHVESPEGRQPTSIRVPANEPGERTVFIPDVNVWVGWTDSRDRWRPPPGSVRRGDASEPRGMGRSLQPVRRSTDRSGERADPSAGAGDPVAGNASGENAADQSRTEGRTTTGDENSMRGGRRDEGDERAEAGEKGGVDLGDLFSSKKKDDDDDDEDRLLPAAVAGALAVGGLAVLGGTFGYFSSVSKAPIGLMAGYVQPGSGILLQVAVNEQVFGKAEGPENVVASLTSFYDLFHAPIQPAVGLGIRATEEGTETAVVKPSISFGFVGNFGKIVLLAGYDVTTPDFRFGIGVNFRARR